MALRPIRLRARLVAAALAACAIPSCPVLAQYGGNGGGSSNDPPDYQPRYYRHDGRPRCHYADVRVYDEAHGVYVTRRERVCDDGD